MLRTTKLITISILPELLRETEKVAKEENRTRSELIREALRRYIAAREWRRLQRYGIKKAKKLRLKEEDVERLVDEYRSDQAND
jgi:CopG family transcriptional regulator / antitoxin EndoAI